MVCHPTLKTIILTNSFKKTQSLKNSLRLTYIGMFSVCSCSNLQAKRENVLLLKETSTGNGKYKNPTERRSLTAKVSLYSKQSLKKRLELKKLKSINREETCSRHDSCCTIPLGKADSFATIHSKFFDGGEEVRNYPLVKALMVRRSKSLLHG